MHIFGLLTGLHRSLISCFELRRRDQKKKQIEEEKKLHKKIKQKKNSSKKLQDKQSRNLDNTCCPNCEFLLPVCFCEFLLLSFFAR
jgi:hypothetical protein